MKILIDCFGRQVRLSDERLAHILEHAEMTGMAAEIERVLRQPQLVRRSRSDTTVRVAAETTLPRLRFASALRALHAVQYAGGKPRRRDVVFVAMAVCCGSI